MSKTLLIHVCCAPCAAPSLETAEQDRWDQIILFYSNSNIYPREEYDLRLRHVRRLAEIRQLKLLEDRYDHESWLDAVRGLEDEPEQGERCRKCFEYNLRRSAQAAARFADCCFTTTLTVSPHKKSAAIFAIGQNWPEFAAYDFKKKDGFKRGMELCRQYGLYRQNYCGCEFSRHREKPDNLKIGGNNILQVP